MKFRAIDGNNDWVFGSGLQSYFTDQSALSADIKTRIQTFYQECFYDPTFGVPWFSILGQKNYEVLSLTLSNEISKVDGVIKVLDVSLSLDNARNAKVNYLVNTIYSKQMSGEVTL